MTIVNHFYSFVMNGYYYVLVEKHVTSDDNPNKTKKYHICIWYKSY